jgi:hypothetical protein
MNFYYSFLLLLVVLSAYSKSPPYAKPPDSTIVTVCPNNHTSLGVLAPVLTQNEMYMSFLPQNEVYMSILQIKNNVFHASHQKPGYFVWITKPSAFVKYVIKFVEEYAKNNTQKIKFQHI